MVRYMWGTESENRVSTRCFHFKLFEIIDQFWSNTIFSHPILVAHGPLTPNIGQTLFLRPNTVRPLSFHFQLLATPRPFVCITLVFEGLSYPGLPRSSHNQYQSTTVFLHSITVNQCPLIFLNNTGELIQIFVIKLWFGIKSFWSLKIQISVVVLLKNSSFFSIAPYNISPVLLNF